MSDGIVFNQKLESLLSKIVSIPSEAPLEKDLAFFCADYLQSFGFEVLLQQWDKNRFNVIAKKPALRQDSNQKWLLLSSHLDTVPPFSWGASNPYALKQDGEYLRGLGVYDMKGGLALILHCASILKPSDNIGIKIVLTSDEEIISAGTWAAAEAGHYNDVILAVVPEIIDTPSTLLETKPSHKPMPIVLGRRGRAVYQLLIKTMSVHGAEGRGTSALDIAAKVVEILHTLKLPAHPRLPKSTAFVRRIFSQSQALELPTSAQVDIDVHFVPPYTPQTFASFLQEKILSRLTLPPNASFELSLMPRKTPYLQPYETELSNDNVRRFLDILGKEAKEPAKIEYGLTVADENILASYHIPCISWAPRGGCAHSPHEWLSRADFARMAVLYPSVLQKFLDQS